MANLHKKTALKFTIDSERGASFDLARIIARVATVLTHILQSDLHDEKRVIIGHHVKSAVQRGREILPAIFLECDFCHRESLSPAFQFCIWPESHGHVRRLFYEWWENCKK